MTYIMLHIEEPEYALFLNLLTGAFKEGKIEYNEKEEDVVIFDEKLSFEDYYILHSILIRLFEK